MCKNIFNKTIPIIIMVLIATILLSSAVYAATWEYKYPIIIKDTSGVSRTYIPVMLGFGGQNLVNAGKIDADGLNANLQQGTSDSEYMMSTTQVTAVVPSLPASGQVQLDLYTGYSPEESIYPIILGDKGYVTVADGITEIGNNGQFTLSGCKVDTSQTGVIAYKDVAYMIEESVSGTLTASIRNPLTFSDYFIADAWTDVGTKIHVNTVTYNRMEFESEETLDDNRCYYDLAAISNTTWLLDTQFSVTSVAGLTGDLFWGLWSSATNYQAYAGDAVLCMIQHVGTGIPSVRIIYADGAGGIFGGTINLALNTTYYMTLSRDTATSITLSVYSDIARLNHVTGSPVNMVIPATVTSLRYVQASNYAGGAGAGREIIGVIDNVEFLNASTARYAVNRSISGIMDNTDYDMTFNITGGNFIFTVGGSSNSTAFAGSVPNTAFGYNFMGIGVDSALCYCDNITITPAGTREVWLEPISMLTGTNLPDREATGGSNNGTIVWGTNENIDITYGSPESYASYSATANATSGFVMPSASMPATWFSAGEGIAGLPFYDMISSMATGSGVPAKTIYALIIIGLAFCAFLSVIMYTKSAFIAVLSMTIVLFIGSSMTIVPMWVPFVILIVDIGIMYLIKQVSY